VVTVGAKEGDGYMHSCGHHIDGGQNLVPTDLVDEQLGQIQKLDHEFSNLQQRLAHLEASASAQFKTDSWTRQAEQSWLIEVDPIRDRMFAIAMELANMTAISEQDLRTKAKVLLDFANSETGDVVHLLATALCSDILKLHRH
jgi:hypothetical protein